MRREDILLSFLPGILTAITHYLYFLAVNPIYNVGPNAAYYEQQVYFFLSHGRFFYSAPPVAFIMFALFTLISQNIIVGIRLGLSFAGFVEAVGVYYLTKDLSYRKDVAFVAAISCAVAPFSFNTLAGNFFKQLVAMSFFPWGWLFLFRALEWHSYRYSLLSAIFAFLIMATHLPSAALYALSIVIISGIYLIHRIKARYEIPIIFINAFIAAGAMALAYYISSTFFSGVEGAYSSISSDVSNSLDTFLNAQYGMDMMIHIAEHDGSLFYFYGALVCAFILALVGCKNIRYLSLGAIIMSGLGWSVIAGGEFQWRFMLLTVPAIVVGTGVAIYTGLSILRKAKKKYVITIGLVLFVIITYFSWPAYFNRFGEFDTSYEKDLRKIATRIDPQNSLILAPHGMEYFAQFYIQPSYPTQILPGDIFKLNSPEGLSVIMELHEMANSTGLSVVIISDRRMFPWPLLNASPLSPGRFFELLFEGERLIALIFREDKTSSLQPYWQQYDIYAIDLGPGGDLVLLTNESFTRVELRNVTPVTANKLIFKESPDGKIITEVSLPVEGTILAANFSFPMPQYIWVNVTFQEKPSIIRELTPKPEPFKPPPIKISIVDMLLFWIIYPEYPGLLAAIKLLLALPAYSLYALFPAIVMGWAVREKIELNTE